jgi:hypothetical protein
MTAISISRRDDSSCGPLRFGVRTVGSLCQANFSDAEQYLFSEYSLNKETILLSQPDFLLMNSIVAEQLNFSSSRTKVCLEPGLHFRPSFLF